VNGTWLSINQIFSAFCDPLPTTVSGAFGFVSVNKNSIYKETGIK
jgi:hypothetical protein